MSGAGSCLNTAPRLVVILGCQRSGTTLTGQILGAHPNAVLIDETDGLYEWFAGLTPDNPLDQGQLGPVLRRAARNYKNSASRLEIAGDETAFLKPHVTHLILKAPNLTYAWERIAGLNIGTAIVGLVRDPRAVIASMERLSNVPMVANQLRWIESYPDLAKDCAEEIAILKDPGQPDRVKRAIVWKIKTRLIDKFSQAGLISRTVYYEDLVTHPRRVIPDLLSALDLSDSAAVFAHHEELAGMGPGKTARGRKIDQRSQEAWKDSFLATETRQILAAIGDVAGAHGYRLED